jgi:hypothetical protein
VTSLPDIIHSMVIQGKHKLNKQSDNTSGFHIITQCLFQMFNLSKMKYGHLPSKEAEAEPWKRLCVDLMGPYTIKHKGAKPLQLWCLTTIDPAKGWLEIKELTNKEAITPANVVEQTWLTCYPIPQI